MFECPLSVVGHEFFPRDQLRNILWILRFILESMVSFNRVVMNHIIVSNIFRYFGKRLAAYMTIYNTDIMLGLSHQRESLYSCLVILYLLHINCVAGYFGNMKPGVSWKQDLTLTGIEHRHVFAMSGGDDILNRHIRIIDA